MLLCNGDIVLKHFKVIKPRGEGGQAYTYEGVNIRSNKNVLIKARKSSSNNAAAIERFKREGAIRIDDPHIVTPIAGDGDFIIFPLIDALTLEEIINDGKYLLKNDDALIIMVKTAQAIVAIHQNNMIHRDIKPSNILCDPLTKLVYLIDLGAAKHFDLPNMTKCDNVIASPMNASPEQLTNPSRVDVRSDIYSLGCTGYKILTNNDPFEGETVPEIMTKVVNEMPIPIRHYNPGAPDILVTAIERMMAKNPDDRFSSMDEVITYLTGQTPQSTSGYYCLACGQKSGPESCPSCGRRFLNSKLVVRTPENQSRTYNIAIGDYCIGREQLGNQKHVSKKHCNFSVSENGRIRICDNHSTNKTYVNRKTVHSMTALSPNDIVEIADLTAFIVNAKTN